MNALLDRLSRRGELKIAVADGTYNVSLKAHGPWVGGRCTSDKHDLFQHCHFGASNFHGEGPDLDALLIECDEVSRPPTNAVDDIVWQVERRRSSRPYGPPLPSYISWRGWQPGTGQWLSEGREYLAGYERDRVAERNRKQQDEESRRRSERRERERVRRVLEGT